MKNYLYLIIVLLLAACNNKQQLFSQQYIEPCEYYIMSYQVKDIFYHDSVQSLLTDDSYMSIVGDSIINITDELGQFLFKGNRFTYKVINDSLILINNRQRISCKISELAPNSFKLEVDNKYFDRIDFIKPKDKRRKVVEKVELRY